MLTSIIIPTHNGLAHLRPCIESVRKFTAMGQYELIVVDDGSSDDTRCWLAEQPDIRLIALTGQRGFPGACNRGLAAATGDYLLLLNDDTIVTPRWLDQLLAALTSAPDIGAVGPVTNAASYSSTVAVTYRSTEEMLAFADKFNVFDPAKWERRMKLIGFCLLMKRAIYEEIGPLDERFAPGNCEDDDYSMRIHLAGWQMRLCKDTFIHHSGMSTFRKNMNSYANILQMNMHKFMEKWGFYPHSLHIQEDEIAWMDDPPDRPLRILEIDCACGATLLKLKDRYPQAELFGIERNREAAAAAERVAAVIVGESEIVPLNEPYGSLDYILIGDALNWRAEPVNFLRKYIPYLKDDGKLIARIANLSHHAVIRNLLKGNWIYSNDREPLRMYTLDSITRIFRHAGFFHLEYQGHLPAEPLAPREENWVGKIVQLTGQAMDKQLRIDKYLVKAHRTQMMPGTPHSPGYLTLKRLLRRLEWEVEPKQTRADIVGLYASGAVNILDVRRILERDAVNRKMTAHKLAAILTEAGAASTEPLAAKQLLEGLTNE